MLPAWRESVLDLQAVRRIITLTKQPPRPSVQPASQASQLPDAGAPSDDEITSEMVSAGFGALLSVLGAPAAGADYDRAAVEVFVAMNQAQRK